MDYSIFSKIKLAIFDVDGVLTDSKVLVTEEGSFLRSMSVKDGQGIKTAISLGLPVAIITKGNSKGVRKRLEYLDILDIYDEVIDKELVFRQLLEKYNCGADEVMYMGDDLPDIPVLKLVGLSACPADAVPEVKAVSQFISSRGGGDMCARDILERILRAQGKWNF